jgi:hypothetical protein
MAITAPRVFTESTQYQNQNIGVARVYEGAQTASAIVNGANEIAGIAFRYAAEDAEQQGTEMAQSIELAEVMAIDPSTGEPVALNQMGGMGRIGSEAYRNVINARFQQSIEEEIRNQAQVLSAQYEQNADGVALYSDAMAGYISSMSENATGQWRTFIEDTGTTYLNRTRTALAVRQMRAQRAAMARQARAANAQAAAAMQASVAQGGLAALGIPPAQTEFRSVESALSAPLNMGSGGLSFGGASPMALQAGDASQPTLSYSDLGPAGAIAYDVAVGINDNVEADILPPTAYEGWSRVTREAVLNGYTEHFLGNIDLTDPNAEDQLDALRFAINSRNVPAILQIAPEFTPFVSLMVNDPRLMDDWDGYANRLLQNAADLSNIQSAPARNAQQAADALAVANIGLDTNEIAGNVQANVFYDAARGEYARARADGISGALSLVQYSFNTAREELDPDRRAALIERGEAAIDASLRGIARGVASRLTSDEIGLLRSAINSEDYGGSDEAASISRSLDQFVPFDGEVYATFDNLLSDLQDSTSYRQNQLEYSAAQEVRDRIVPAMDELPFLDGVALTSSVGEIITSIAATPNLLESDRLRFTNQAYTLAAQGAINAAFTGLDNLNDVSLAQQYAANPQLDATSLPQEVRDSIDLAREYAGQAGQERLVTTSANTAADLNRRNIQARMEREEQNRIAAEAMLGINPEGSDAAVLQMVNATRVSQGEPPLEELGAAFFLSPTSMSRFGNVFNEIYNRPGLEPPGLLDVFSAAANGGGLNYTALSHWENYRTIETSSGVFRRAIQGMSDAEIARLDLMLELSRIMPLGDLDAVSQTARTYLNENRGQIEFDGRSIPDIVSGASGFSDLGPLQQQAMTAFAEYAAAMANTVPGSIDSRRQLRRVIERAIDANYPEGDGNVHDVNADGRLVRRTPYDPNRYLGEHTSDWYNIVRRELQEQTNAPVVFAGEIDMNLRELQRFPPDVRSALSRDLVDGTSYVTLVPVGPDSRGGISYVVYQVNRDTLEMEPVIHQSGELEGLVFQVSTAEESILNVIQLDQASQAQRDMEYGQMVRGVMDQPMDLAPGFGDVLSGIREGMTADFVPDLDQIAELESELNVARQAMSNAGEMGRELMRQEVLELQAMLVDYIRRYNAANR